MAERDRRWPPALGPWLSQAACHDVADSSIFFTEEEPADEAAAKQICGGCVVRDACLSYALRYRQSGIWGGLTEKERRQTKRRRRQLQ